ncbi:MAG: dTMP kinase [Endomicrobium sp.]|jgi:dTMP kinase|nr:dTMP kinase [Endomicrobium sp.]
MKKYTFITIEGGEGAGKTTQSLLLKKYLEQKGYQVLLTREPGGTVLAEAIRLILLNPNSHLSALSELFLYEASRAQHMEEFIMPALKSGKVVICDRFIDATVAYQGYGRKLNLQLINKLNKIASLNIVPNLTIYIDIVPYKGLANEKEINKDSHIFSNIKEFINHNFGFTVNWSGKDRIERECITFHNNVRKGYLNQARKYPRRIKVIKTQKTSEKTQELIRKIINTVI